jgi:MFS family permease
VLAWWTSHGVGRTSARGERASTDAAPEDAALDDARPIQDRGGASAGGSASGAGAPRRRLLAGFFVGNALLAVFDEAVYQHGYSLGVARGLSAQEAAWLLGLVSLALTVGMLLGGPLSDVVGRQRVLVGAATLVLVATLGLMGATADALWIWGPLDGVGLGASIAVRSAAWGDAFAGPGRGRAVGIVASGYPVGAALTIWLGAAWLDAGGSFEALYLTAAIASGLWAVVGGALTSPVNAARRATGRPALARPEPAGA